MMFSNTPKKVVIFKKTTGKINSVYCPICVYAYTHMSIYFILKNTQILVFIYTYQKIT
jgi:hypothetical protein